MNDLYRQPQHQQDCGTEYDHGGQEASSVAHDGQVDHLGTDSAKHKGLISKWIITISFYFLRAKSIKHKHNNM